MTGLTVEKCFDYSVGPGPRIKLTIDCNTFSPLWENEPKLEFISAVKDVFAEMAKFNSNNLSIVLLNDGKKIDDWNDVNYNIELSDIFCVLTTNFNIDSVWVYSQNDFLSLLNIPSFHWNLSNYYCKNAEMYYVCGQYDPNCSEIMIKGEQCEFPVKPLYRQSFNQRIWKINKKSQRDITEKIDTFYNIWKKDNKN